MEPHRTFPKFNDFSMELDGSSSNFQDQSGVQFIKGAAECKGFLHSEAMSLLCGRYSTVSGILGKGSRELGYLDGYIKGGVCSGSMVVRLDLLSTYQRV